ncbi:MAG: hypothetical protein M3457_04420, partial [Chloroflexota bacterium]|nr:hypothetical protein [Chloroflexota bacterium]
ASDLRAMGLSSAPGRALPVAQIAQVDFSGTTAGSRHTPSDWFAIEHGHLLDALRSSIESEHVAFMPGATVHGFLWAEDGVCGVQCEGGTTYPAEVVVLADESSPRLAEQLGLRPDWSPSELMHVGKRRYAADPTVVRDRLGAGADGYEVISFVQSASWGSPGWGVVIPGPDSITIAVAMSLEEAMVSTRHISEYLDEIERQPPVRDRIAGLSLESSMTEVVPTGGFDSRNTFHTDGVVVVNDLVGVTHPLNRDGLSSNLAVCHAAARTIANAVASNDYSKKSLGQFSKSIVDHVISPVDAARRKDKALRARPRWMWASKADLFPTGRGVTAGPKPATLYGMSDSGVWHRLRGFGRIPGVRRHAPGEYDE